MKKIIFFIFALSCVFHSCLPYRIVYSVDKIYPSALVDSIGVKMVDSAIMFFPGSNYIHFTVEVINNKSNGINLGSQSKLMLQSGSNEWSFGKTSNYSEFDSIYSISHDETVAVPLCCFTIRDSVHVNVFEHYFSSKKANHKLILWLDIQDNSSNRIRKEIVLKPLWAKRRRW